MQRQFDEAMATKKALQDDADACQKKMDAANRLIGGLAGERSRWELQSASFDDEASFDDASSSFDDASFSSASSSHASTSAASAETRSNPLCFLACCMTNSSTCAYRKSTSYPLARIASK